MEHSHLIAKHNVTQFYFFYWTFFGNNISELLEVCPILTYWAKTFKFINMFPNIKRTRSQIMIDMKYIYIKESKEYFINEKV
jgi:hypothetical protein